MKLLKRFVAVGLAAIMAFSLLAGCGASNNGGAAGSETDGADASSEERPLYKIDVYTQLANYAGMQVGWFGDIVKKKFNMELNIIPTDDGTFATRMAAGNLGDLILFGNNGDEFKDAIEAGMLLDWYSGDILEKYGPDVKQNMGTALQHNADVFGGGTKSYGFGHNVSSSPENAEEPFYHPDIRFDLYQRIGSPEIPNMMGYLDVLKQMVDLEPTGDSGLPSYGISLFSDWDGDTVMSVKAMGAFYGYDEFGFTLYDVEKNTVVPIFDNDSLYLQALKFFNKAFQMGILDPDSATQTFSDLSNKYVDGRVYYSIFNWLGPTNYNSVERLAEGKGMFAVAAKDQKNITYGGSIYGAERIWSIGSKAEHPERIMELINWLCTPDGFLEFYYGPKGVIWDYDADNKTYLTELGIKSQTDPTVEMPADVGGGQYVDGQNKINNTTFSLADINPISGESYDKNTWASELTRDVGKAKQDWQEAMGAISESQYLKDNGHYAVVIASDFVKDSRSPELEQKYAQVSSAIKEGSWKAIYAKDDADFDKIVENMISQAKGFGYDECVAWDTEQGVRRAEAVKKALGE